MCKVRAFYGCNEQCSAVRMCMQCVRAAAQLASRMLRDSECALLRRVRPAHRLASPPTFSVPQTILLFTLLVLLILTQMATAVDHSNFKTCEQSGFCKYIHHSFSSPSPPFPLAPSLTVQVFAFISLLTIFLLDTPS